MSKYKDVPVVAGPPIEIDANAIAAIIEKHIEYSDAIEVKEAANAIIDYLAEAFARGNAGSGHA